MSQILLYDFERDRDLRPGEAILVFEDGKTRRVKESSLYEKEKINVRDPKPVEKPSAVRGRPARSFERRKTSTRRSPKGKRPAVYPA